MHKDFTSVKAIRAIAVFEVAKGLLGLAAAIALISLLHKDLEQVARNVLDYLHIDPAGEMAHTFVEKASQINETNIIIFIVLAFGYTILRLAEAYGLWFLRAWGEWIGIISGSIYVPVELYEIFQKPTFTRFVILFGNILIVLYLGYVRYESHYKKVHSTEVPDVNG